MSSRESQVLLVPGLRWGRARVVHPAPLKQQEGFWVLFHQGEADQLGAPLNFYRRFSTRREAETVGAVQMAERSFVK
jgi:hypothetical protein